MTYCVNIIENEKRRISKIGKEVQEIFSLEKNSILSEKVLNKLKNITNLNNCEYPLEKYSDSENQIEETINDITMPEAMEPKEIFSSFAQPYSKELDDLFGRASIVCEEERKNEENFDGKNNEKDMKKFEENFREKSEKLKDFDEKSKDFGEKSNENLEEKSKKKSDENFDEKSKEKSNENLDEKSKENLKEKSNEKTNENLKEKTIEKSTKEKTNEKTKEKSNENFEENKLAEIQSNIPLNISKSLEEIMDFLKETCQIKYVNFLIFL